MSADQYTRDSVLVDLDRYLYYGVGTVAVLGSDRDDTAFQIRDEQQSGALNTTRIMTAGRGITSSNGFPLRIESLSDVPYQVANEDEARAAVQELAVQGVDFIKVWVDDDRRVSGQIYRFGQLTNQYSTVAKLSPALYGAIIDEAHQNNIRVVAHVRYLADAKGLVDAGIDGLVHVSDMSWTKRIEHPSEVVQKGQEIDVLVLDVDAENKRISLGVKQLTDDPWPQISERLAPGVELDGHVVRVQEKGVLVDLGDDVEGFVPVSQSGVDDPEKLEEYYGPSDEVSLRVIESDTANRRIVLEVTDTPDRKPQEEIEAARAAAEADAAAKAEAEGGPDDEDGRSVHRPTAPPSDDADDGADTEAPASPPPAAADAEAEAVAAGGAEESPESEAEEASEAEAEEAPEAEAEETPEAEAEAEEAPEAEAEEAPEAEAEEAPEAEAEEAEAEEAPEAEAEEAEADEEK